MILVFMCLPKATDINCFNVATFGGSLCLTVDVLRMK